MKYILNNDLRYLINNRKTILSFLLFVPLLLLLLNISAKDLPVSVIARIMGTNLNVGSSTIIEFIMYLFNLFMFVFLISDIYIKDISYQLDNIFLRMKPINWYTKKSICFMFIIFVLKMLQYSFFFISYIILNNKNILGTEYIMLFMSDILYILAIQYAFLLIYIIFSVFNINRIISFIIFILLIIITPKNIYNLSSKLLLLFLMICLFQAIIIAILKLKAKKVNENLGGNL